MRSPKEMDFKIVPSSQTKKRGSNGKVHNATTVVIKGHTLRFTVMLVAKGHSDDK